MSQQHAGSGPESGSTVAALEAQVVQRVRENLRLVALASEADRDGNEEECKRRLADVRLGLPALQRLRGQLVIRLASEEELREQRGRLQQQKQHEEEKNKAAESPGYVRLDVTAPHNVSSVV